MKLSITLALVVPLFGGTVALAALTAAERALVTAEGRRAVDPSIVAMLDEPAPLAARAALALGRTKRTEARVPLRAHLNSQDPSLRATVAFALGLSEDPESLDEVGELAHTDSNSAVRYAAVDAVGRIVSADPSLATTWPSLELIAAMRTDVDPLVRGHAAIALEAFRTAADAGKGPAGETVVSLADQVATSLAEAFDRERNASVRWHIVWTIFRAYATRVPRELLVRALRDRDELVRIEAVRAWGRRSDPDAKALVEPLLHDRSWRVQLQAREALHAIAKEPLTEHLTALPADLNLPRPEAPNREPPLPRPSLAPKIALPTPDDIPAIVPFAPLSAAELDGPLPGPHPRARLRTTKGDIVVRLYPEWAPMTVANFLRLANAGYYDNNRWFRIVPDFVVQSGDPNDNGEGDAGYALPAEENPLEQRAGIISMGLNYKDNRAVRDSAGTQFYITISPQPHLDRDFTVFGELESGMATVAYLIESDRIIRVDRLPDR